MASNGYKLTEIARRDLDETLDYISNVLFNPIAARDFFDKITEMIDTICAFPESCPIVENDFVVKTDIRKAFVGNYIMYYSFDKFEHMVWIIRIVYGRRNLEEILRSLP